MLITGATAGIGEACAWRFAESGCKLVLLGRRAERLDSLQGQLSERFKVQIQTIVFDVRDIDKVDGLLDVLEPEFKEVDVLVNNAGLALGVAGVQDNDLEDAKNMYQTNVLGVIAFTRTFSRGMVARNSGHIVNISSIAAHEAYAGGSMYCGTKHAVDAFTTAARHDLVGKNIRVTAISPGAVETEFSVVRFKGDESAAKAVYAGIEPLLAADIADQVLYAVTRPGHVQIADIVSYATYQASAKNIARVLPH